VRFNAGVSSSSTKIVSARKWRPSLSRFRSLPSEVTLMGFSTPKRKTELSLLFSRDQDEMRRLRDGRRKRTGHLRCCVDGFGGELGAFF
jgi:hypothetical protein